MNSSAKKWQSIRKDQRVEIGLVRVDIGAHGKQYDHFTDLILKRAKEVLKDALVKTAEFRGGKLASWEDDTGTFLFLIEGPDSFENCCLAALEMLEQLPSVKQEVQLSTELESLIAIRIACDTGTVDYDPEAEDFPGEFADKFKKNQHAVSVENELMITERVFRQLKNPLKSRFVKWKRSTELGVDLYATANPPAPVWEKDNPADEQSVQDAVMPIPERQHTQAQGRFKAIPEALKSGKILSVGVAALLSLMIFGLVRFWPASPPPPPQYPELVQSEEWRIWRKQVHDKLSAGEVNDDILADAIRIKMPARPEQASAAMRRDQAIADVVMAYKGTRDLLWKRFGIDENNFLGTGLSKPNTTKDYVAASVHEYLIPNLPDNDDDVWTWKLEYKDLREMTVKELCETDAKLLNQKNSPVQRIADRVNKKDVAKPAVIRFAMLAEHEYKRTLGRKDSYRVFASNLAEVWDTSVTDAAARSGHTYTQGKLLYVWVFVPEYSTLVVPATWGEVLNNLPTWLSEKNRN